MALDRQWSRILVALGGVLVAGAILLYAAPIYKTGSFAIDVSGQGNTRINPGLIETIYCADLIGVDFEDLPAGFRIQYPVRLLVDVSAEGNQLSLREGALLRLEAQVQFDGAHEIDYVTEWSEERITNLVIGDADPEEWFSEFLPNNELDRLIELLRWDSELREIFIHPEIALRDVLLEEELSSSDLAFDLALAGLEFSPTEPQSLSEKYEVNWSVFPEQEGKYSGVVIPRGSMKYSPGALRTAVGEVAREISLELDENSSLEFTIEVKKAPSTLKSVLLSILAFIGAVIMASPKLLPLFDRFTKWREERAVRKQSSIVLPNEYQRDEAASGRRARDNE